MTLRKWMLPLLGLAFVACSGESNGTGDGTGSGVVDMSFPPPDTGVTPDMGVEDMGEPDLGQPDMGFEDMGVEPTVTRVRAMPSTANIEVGETVQIQVEATLDTGVREDRTAEASFQSSPRTVATVDDDGLVTAVGPGNAIVTVSLEGLSTTVRIGVATPEEGFYLFREALRNGAMIEVADDMGGDPTANVTIDETDGFAGTNSLRIEVPFDVDPNFEGDVSLVLPMPTDLAQYNALEFDVKTDQNNVPTTLELIQSDDSFMSAAIPVIGDWQHFVIVLPNAAELTEVETALRIRAGASDVAIKFDEIRYLTLDPLPTIDYALIPSRDLTGPLAPGDTFTVDGLASITTTNPEIVLETEFSLRFFDGFSSTESAVATVDANGLVTAVDEGVAQILGTVDGVDTEPLDVEVVVPPTPPNVPAPTPMFPPADVISIYSDAYTDVARSAADSSVDNATPGELTVMGDNVRYFDFGAGPPSVELLFEPPANQDLTDYTTLRFDMWVGNVSSFEVVILDAGADGILQRASPDDLFSFILFDGTTMPPVVKNQWMTFEVPLDDFGLMKRNDFQAMYWFPNLAERIHFDNILFVK